MNTYTSKTSLKSQTSSANNNSSSMYRRFAQQQSQHEPITVPDATMFHAPFLEIHRKRNSNEQQRRVHDVAATSHYENYRYRDNVTTAVASSSATLVDARSTSYSQRFDDGLDNHDIEHILTPVTPKQPSRLPPLQIRSHHTNRDGTVVQQRYHSHNNSTTKYENDHRFHPSHHHHHHHQMKWNMNINESYQRSPNIIDADYDHYHHDHLDYNNVHNESDIDRDVHMFRDDYHDPMSYGPYNNQQPPYQSLQEVPAITVLRENYSSQKISAIVSPMYDYEDRKLVSSGPSSVASSRRSNSTQQQSWEESVHPPPFVDRNSSGSNSGYSKYNRGMKNDQYQRYEYQQENGNFHQPYNRHPIPLYADDIAGTTNYEKKEATSDFVAYQHPSRNDGRSNRNSNIANNNRYSEMKQTKMIEITPGHRLRLRDSDETILAIQNDYYVPCSCAICSSSSSDSGDDYSEPLFCIQDAEYFICPICKSLNPLQEAENGPTDHCLTFTCTGKVGGGVGLGFTMTTLNAMQKQIVSNFHHTVHQLQQQRLR